MPSLASSFARSLRIFSRSSCVCASASRCRYSVSFSRCVSRRMSASLGRWTPKKVAPLKRLCRVTCPVAHITFYWRDYRHRRIHERWAWDLPRRVCHSSSEKRLSPRPKRLRKQHLSLPANSWRTTSKPISTIFYGQSSSRGKRSGPSDHPGKGHFAGTVEVMPTRSLALSFQRASCSKPPVMRRCRMSCEIDGRPKFPIQC